MINRLLIILVALVLLTDTAMAEINSTDILDGVLLEYQAVASGWVDSIKNRAEWIFWLLVTISMVWTFGFMLLSKADIGELFSEFIRFTIFVGFFWWLLINGDDFAESIIDSLKQIAAEANGSTSSFSPSGIVDIGFSVFHRAIENGSLMSPLDSALAVLISLIILTVISLIAVNVLILIISAWFLSYAGIFYLGFGGSKWTSEIAINYYRTVLSVAVQLFAMVLLIGISESILSAYYANMSAGIAISELGVVLIVAITLLLLVDKIPPLLSGIITGASVGSVGAGSFGAGAAVGAAAAAAGVASTMLSSTFKQAAGGASAIMAAASEANASVSGSDTSVSDMASSTASFATDSGGSDSGVTTPPDGSTPYSQAAGFSSGAGSSEFGEGPSSSSSDSNSQSGGFSGVVKKAGEVSVATTVNLAKGVGSVAKQKASEMKANFQHDVANTVGGKIASSIRANSSQKFNPDLENEIKAFVEKTD